MSPVSMTTLGTDQNFWSLRSLLRVYLSGVNKTTQTLQSFPPDEFLSFFNASETWVAPEHKTCSGQLLWKDSDLGENVF